MTKVVNSERLRRIDLFFRFVDQGLVSVGNFAIALLLARLLGPTQFGVYALLWPIVNLTLGASWAFISSPMQASVAHPPAHGGRQLFDAMFSYALGIGLLGGALVVCTTGWFAQQRSSASVALMGAAMTMAVVLQDFARRWLLATAGASTAVLSDACRHIGVLCALGWMAYEVKTGTLVQCLAIMTLGCLAGLLPIMREILKFRWDWYQIKLHARQHGLNSRWLLASVGLQSLASATPIYALGASVGVNQAGGFRAVLNLLSPVVSLTEALETFLPLRCHQALALGGVARARLVLQLIGVPFTAIIAGFTLVVCMEGKWFLSTLFGKSYECFAPALWPLAVAMLLQFMTYLLNVYRRVLRQTRRIFFADAASLLTLVSVVSLVSADHELVLIAWAVALSQFVKLISLLWHKHAETHHQ